MGNTDGNEKESDAKLQGYLAQLQFIRKEHSKNLGKDIDIYRDINP